MSYNVVDQATGDVTRVAGNSATALYTDSPIGVILPYGGTTAPTGWLMCHGQAISRTDYAELFAVIGTAFGSGDGSTTFNVPDMREATAKGAGETGQTVGAHVKSGGLAVGEFIDDRVQEHTHQVNNATNGYHVTSGSETNIYGVLRSMGGDKFDTGNNTSGRSGDTTEVKAVGTNFIIKALQTEVPADFEAAIDECAKLAENNSLTGVQTLVGKDVIHKNTIIDSTTTPAELIVGNSVQYFQDTNGNTLAAIYNHQKTDGSIDLNIVTSANHSNGGKVLINGHDIIEKLYPTPIIVPVSGTYGNIIKQVLNAIDVSKLTKDSVVVVFGIVFHYVGMFSYYYQFSAQIASPGEAKLLSITMAGSTSTGYYYHITSIAGSTDFVDATNVTLTSQNVTVYY